MPTHKETGWIDDDLHQSIEDPDMFLSTSTGSAARTWTRPSAPHLVEFAARIPALLDEPG